MPVMHRASPLHIYLCLTPYTFWSAGTLSSAMSIFMVMRLGTWLFGARALYFQAELYLGLAVFIGYLLVDTQVRLLSGHRLGEYCQ